MITVFPPPGIQRSPSAPVVLSQNLSTAATPLSLDLYRANIKAWYYDQQLVNNAPHATILRETFDGNALSMKHFSNSGTSAAKTGDGKYAFTATTGETQAFTMFPAVYGGPAWLLYIKVETFGQPASGTNIIDLRVNCPYPAEGDHARCIFARAWRTDASQTCSVEVEDGGSADAGATAATPVTFPSEPFTFGLVCNLNSFCAVMGDADGRNMRIVSPWKTVAAFDMATDAVRLGDGELGGLRPEVRFLSSTDGTQFEISDLRWTYLDGVGTRETYLLSDLDGNAIAENGKVWMSWDRTLPYDPAAASFLPNGAQVVMGQYNPSTGRLEEETARFFYKIDGRTTGAQNSKFVWDTTSNIFHCYIPDWKEAPNNQVRILYGATTADIRFGVHVIEPTALTLPTSADFDFAAGDFLYDASMVRIGPGDYLLLVSWSDLSAGYPSWYKRVMFRGNSPNNFTSVVGWDATPERAGEGHRIVLVGGERWVIAGDVVTSTQSFNVWKIVPSETPGVNWLAYQGRKEIEAFNLGGGNSNTYPLQPEIIPIEENGGVVYHLITFGFGNWDASMPATTGSVISLQSQRLSLS